jgi:hypothetical protein
MTGCVLQSYPRRYSSVDNPPSHRLEVSMRTFEIVFAVTITLTVGSGLAAGGIAIFGDTRRNLGQRAVAEKFAQIGLLGSAAIVSLLALS